MRAIVGGTCSLVMFFDVSSGHVLIVNSLELGLSFATQRFLKLCCACSDILGIKE